MLSHLTLHKSLWALTALLTLPAAGAGIWRPEVYRGIVREDIIPGAYSQDIISAAAAIALFYLALTARTVQAKPQIVALGLLGYLFYAYGIYVIERAYNGLYLVYMGIFALSFWSLVYAGASLRSDGSRPSLSRRLRLASATGALLQPLIFYPLWIAMLLPLMNSGEQIDSLYSIFILDLCFIMPAFLILAVLTYRAEALSLILLPALYILGFTLIFSLALGEAVKPLFDAALNPASFWPSLLLSLFFLVLGSLHLRRLQLSAGVVPPSPPAAQRNDGSLRR
jgi:hypothetical protein